MLGLADARSPRPLYLQSCTNTSGPCSQDRTGTPNRQQGTELALLRTPGRGGGTEMQGDGDTGQVRESSRFLGPLHHFLELI